MFKCFTLILVVGVTIGEVLSLSDRQDEAKITLELNSIYNGQLFCAQIKAGQGDHEKAFNLLVSTSLAVTWLASTEVSSQKRGYEYDEIVSVNQPDEPTRNGDQLMSTAVRCANYVFRIHWDQMQVGSALIRDQPFAVAFNSGIDRPMEAAIDGMLGLNDGVGESSNIDYLFYNLHKQKYIDHLMYSLYINNTAVTYNRLHTQDDQQQQQQQPEGALVLGGVDSKYYNGHFQYVKLHENQDDSQLPSRSIFISAIQLDWSRAGGPPKSNDTANNYLETINMAPKPTRLKLDSGLVSYVGDKTLLDSIHLGSLGAEPIIGDSLYVFDCRLDNKPDFVFQLRDGPEVRITPEEYVVGEQISNRTLCLSAFRPSKEDVWSFGTKFLRKYYTLFDHENHRVGFAQPR